MSEHKRQSELGDIYADTQHYHINTGDEVIHAKRIPGRFRNLKWMTMSLWSLFFITPYLRWHGEQAILFDIPGRQFHLFSVTIWPQDIWMLSLVLILLAMTLFGVTAVAGRVFCGYFCFQTVWTDVFTWIEDKIEGDPVRRRRLDKAPWSADKIGRKALKHSLWLMIAVLTGISFTAYFTDVFQLWSDLLTFSAHYAALIVIGMFIAGTYILAGFMREQVCFWLCPYARIQSVMVDRDSVIPTYDYTRGEPRGKVRGVAESERGDCIDCKMCIGVCPTGVDIREGLNEGCIMCGLCIDACDSIMEKVDKPSGLIRYMAQKQMEGEILPPLFKRPRVIAYSTIFTLAVCGIIYGLSSIPPVELSVVHARQPLYMMMSDGSVQNKYTIKAVNKTETDLHMHLRVEGLEGLRIADEQAVSNVMLKAGKLVPFNLFLLARPEQMQQQNQPIRIILEGDEDTGIRIVYDSVFVGPK